MPKRKPTTEKTSRILQLYHLFLTCEEVSREEIESGLWWKKINEETGEREFWNDKTISRDIAILKYAGVPIKYSGKRKAYITSSEPEDEAKQQKKSKRRSNKPIIGKSQQRYINKIKRLTKFMDHLLNTVGEDDPCDIEYKNLFPNVSKRTMQRDFAALDDIYYTITYKRKWRETPAERTWVDYDGEVIVEYEAPIGHYYLEPISLGY